jgi:hypothetical protein
LSAERGTLTYRSLGFQHRGVSSHAATTTLSGVGKKRKSRRRESDSKLQSISVSCRKQNNAEITRCSSNFRGKAGAHFPPSKLAPSGRCHRNQRRQGSGAVGPHAALPPHPVAAGPAPRVPCRCCCRPGRGMGSSGRLTQWRRGPPGLARSVAARCTVQMPLCPARPPPAVAAGPAASWRGGR